MNRQLIIEDAQGDERTYEILDDRTVIGRGEDCEITLPGRSVSREHLAVSQAGDDLVVEDLGSSNGSFLNGERLTCKMPLESGDELEIGDFRISIDAPATERAFAATVAGGVEANRRRADARRKSGFGQQLKIFAAIFAVVGGLVIVWAKNVADDEDGSSTQNGDAVAEGDANEAAEESGTARPLIDATARRRAKERSAALETLGLEFDQALLQEDYRGAVTLLERFAGRHGQAPRTFSNRLEEHLDGIARNAVTRFRGEVGAGRGDLALAELDALLDRLPVESAARARLVNFARQARTTADAGGEQPSRTRRRYPEDAPSAPSGNATSTPKPAPKPAAGERGELARIEDAIEAAWKQRDFAAAAASADELDALRATLASEISGDLDRRVRLARRFQGLQTALIEGFAQDDSRFTSIADGSGKRRNLKAIDATGVTFAGEKEALHWRELEDDTWLSLVTKAKLTGEAGLNAAAYVLFAGRAERGEKMLRDIARADASLEDGIQLALADTKGLDLPEGGFTWFDGRYVTRQDLVRLGAKKIIEDGVAKLASSDPLERADAYTSLHALGPRAASAFHRGLTEARGSVLERAKKMGGYAKLARLGEMRTELEGLREHALELIFDEYEYPYPKNTPDEQARHSRANQEIDNRKIPIKKIWESTVKAKVSSDLRQAIALVREYDLQLDQIGISAAEPAPFFLLHLPQADEVDIRTFARDATERDRIDTSYAWMKDNDARKSFAKTNERQQVAVTNEYRLMMGRHAVKMNDRLVEAARMHSHDMSQQGFFAHENPNDPLKRSPWDRMRWVGYYGSGGSENIARSGGDPVSPHNAWIHSSGHHRNILGRGWRLLGSGNDGRNWTQNFSNSEMSDEDREKAGLPKGGIRTLHEEKDKAQDKAKN